MKEYDLERFVSAQEYNYENALTEIRAGKKMSHWIWYIFPQLKGLGHSYRSEYYGIEDEDEAKSYLGHPILGSRLVEITETLLSLKESDPLKVMGSPDDLKLKSCMTLFAYISEDGSIFHQVLEKYFGGAKDEKTMNILEGSVTHGNKNFGKRI